MDVIDFGESALRALARSVACDGAAGVMLANVPYRDIDVSTNPAIGPLLRRYYLLDAPGHHVYLHHLLRSDASRHLHDHPWPFTTILLTHGYREHTPNGTLEHARGAVLLRPAEWIHAIEIREPCWSLVITGPAVRAWGFLTPDGWIDHRKYQRSDYV